MDEYLTTEQIAQQLGVRVETVRRWVRTGQLPGSAVGRAGYRIRQEDLAGFVLRQRQHAAAPPTSQPAAPPVNNAAQMAMEATATAILERMTDGLLLFDFNDQCLYANDAAACLLGLAPQKLLASTLPRLQNMAEAPLPPLSDTSDYFSPTTNRWYQMRAFATPQGRCLSFLDITERKQAEEALQAEQAVLKSFYNGVPFMMGVAELDGDKIVALSANQKVAEFFGRPAKDFSGRSGTELGTPEEIERLWVEQYRKSQREHTVITFEYRDPRPTNSPWLQATVSYIGLGPTGRPRFSFVAADTTERKRNEQALFDTQAEIERQRRFFETILANLKGLVFVWNRDHQFVYVNEALEQLWNIGHGEAVGKTTADLGYPPELSQLFAHQIEQVFQTGQNINAEVPYTSSTGYNGYFEYILSPIHTLDGSVELVVGISQDITERKHMEQALRDSEQRVQAERQKLYDLFMQAPAAIGVFHGPDHVYELANPLAQQITGAHRTHIGKPVREAFPEAEEQGFFEPLDVVYQTGKPFHGHEFPMQLDRRGNGMLETVYFNFVYQPSYSASGDIDGILVYANDVTETVLARKRVEESEAHLQALSNSMPQLVWSARPDGAIDFFNERLSEYAEIARNKDGIYEWQALIHPDDQASCLRRWERSVSTGSLFEHEQRLRMRDGTYRWHLVRGIPALTADGLVLRWYGTKTDIEQLKQLEQQKNTFLGVVSHELKTPVTSAKAFAEVLENRFLREGDEKNALLLGKIRAQMDKLTLLIGDLLDLTRLDTGKLQFYEMPFSFDTLVDSIIEEVQRTTTTHLIQREGTTGAIVYGDRERIGQVLTNLLTNAIKYSPRATTVAVTTAATSQEVSLCVQDFGIGIASEKLPHVFERFFRETGAQEETFPGLGLGLYVASEIVQRHDGKIWAASAKGSGSTFCFSLPLQHIHNTPTPDYQAEGEANS